MIVITNSFDMDKIRKIVRGHEDLCGYIADMVPDRYRHIRAIEHNTRYVLNRCINDDTKISLEDKLWATAELTKNLHVVGYLDFIIDIESFERRINMKKVEEYYKGDKYGKGSRLRTTNS